MQKPCRKEHLPCTHIRYIVPYSILYACVCRLSIGSYTYSLYCAYLVNQRNTTGTRGKYKIEKKKQVKEEKNYNDCDLDLLWPVVCVLQALYTRRKKTAFEFDSSLA